MHYELLVEVHRQEESEALAIARDLSQRFAVNVTVTLVEQGKMFADQDQRTVVATVEP